ncbi:MAG: sulfite exporter TauE/SafE family protein [Verrucomicrobia bacterium]|nr:sulfite exporter TauE/SafE family protein [Kiritimatiellia bacterium]MCB1101948.1 sulfite exporter TauE/SafE family protein [Kiritimatiellia bacterium]MCP5489374.1 sulfite exporter TauE/SafE family protein [Verrucomicrobiota bacterium]
MNTHMLIFMGYGLLVGGAASFTGLGGGFLIMPLLLHLGYSPSKAAGSSFVAILVISISAIAAHEKLAHVDYKAGLLLGLGGIIGAQFGARFLEGIDPLLFRRIFAVVLMGLAVNLLWNR